MPYVDGFVLAVPTDKVADYKKMSRKVGKVWREHGALAYVECLADDVPYGKITSFPRAVQAKEGETVVFSWIVYKSRAQRDAVHKKAMADARMKDGYVDDAVRRQTHDLRRLQDHPGALVLVRHSEIRESGLIRPRV